MPLEALISRARAGNATTLEAIAVAVADDEPVGEVAEPSPLESSQSSDNLDESITTLTPWPRRTARRIQVKQVHAQLKQQEVTRVPADPNSVTASFRFALEQRQLQERTLFRSSPAVPTCAPKSKATPLLDCAPKTSAKAMAPIAPTTMIPPWRKAAGSTAPTTSSTSSGEATAPLHRGAQAAGPWPKPAGSKPPPPPPPPPLAPPPRVGRRLQSERARGGKTNPNTIWFTMRVAAERISPAYLQQWLAEI